MSNVIEISLGLVRPLQGAIKNSPIRIDELKKGHVDLRTPVDSVWYDGWDVCLSLMERIDLSQTGC